MKKEFITNVLSSMGADMSDVSWDGITEQDLAGMQRLLRKVSKQNSTKQKIHVPEGYHYFGGNMFQCRKSAKGHIYALEMSNAGSYEYRKMATKPFSTATVATKANVREFHGRTGFCVCGYAAPSVHSNCVVFLMEG